MMAWAEAVAAADATVELDRVDDALVLDEVRFMGESAGRVPLARRPEGRAEADELALDDRLDELLLGAAEDEALEEGEGELLLDAEELEGEGEGEGDCELDEGAGGGDHVEVDVSGGGVQVLVDGSGGGVHVLVSGSGVQVLVGLGFSSSLLVGLGSSPPPPPPPKFQLIWNTPFEWGAPRASNSDGDRSRSPYEHVGHESTMDADCVIPVSVLVIDT